MFAFECVPCRMNKCTPLQSGKNLGRKFPTKKAEMLVKQLIISGQKLEEGLEHIIANFVCDFHKSRVRFGLGGVCEILRCKPTSMTLQNGTLYAIMEETTSWVLGSDDGLWKAKLKVACRKRSGGRALFLNDTDLPLRNESSRQIGGIFFLPQVLGGGRNMAT